MGYSNYNQRPNGGNNAKASDRSREEAEKIFSKYEFKHSWIDGNGADEALPAFADNIGKELAEKKLTSSKIRSIYGEIKRIQMGEFEKEKSSFYLLKPKVAYAVGRDNKNVGLHLFKKVFDESSKYVKDCKTFHNFSNFMVAILAYHRAYSDKND